MIQNSFKPLSLTLKQEENEKETAESKKMPKKESQGKFNRGRCTHGTAGAHMARLDCATRHGQPVPNGWPAGSAG